VFWKNEEKAHLLVRGSPLGVVINILMNRRSLFLSIIAALGATAVVAKHKMIAAPQKLLSNPLKLTIRTDGLDRHCLVHLPSTYNKANPLPLIVMLHGMGGTATNAVQQTGWSDKADTEGFIVVYPEATRPDSSQPPSLRRNPQVWNDGSGRFHAAERKIDDVKFIRELLDRLMADYSIDRRRIFVTGFSNGASMAFRLGAELADRVAAIAPNAGSCWVAVKPSRGVSLCYITGTADPLNPLEGGFPKLAFGGRNQGGKPKVPVLAAIAQWKKALSCPEAPLRDDLTNGVHTRIYGPGRDGAEVVFITIEDLGHIWAGGENQLPEFLVGKPTDKLKATDVIWNFFRKHSI
jgi:polyhydroxybutyrate depolymerase